MHNMLYRKNGARRAFGFGLAGLLMAVLVLVACGSNKHTTSVACADTVEMAFTLTPTSTHPKPKAPSAPKKQSTTSGGTSSGGSSTSGSSGSSSTGGTSGSRYGTTGSTTTGSTTSGTTGTTTSGSSGTSRYGTTGSTSGTSTGGTTFDKNANTGLSGKVTMPKSVPAPPKGTTRITAPGEKAYTPPNNKVQQPKSDIQAAQASVQNRRFLMSNGSHFTSPVTHHVYYYHPRSYYIGSVYQDIYNPYDGRNYRSSGYGTLTGYFSPYWSLIWATMLVGRC